MFFLITDLHSQVRQVDRVGAGRQVDRVGAGRQGWSR